MNKLCFIPFEKEDRQLYKEIFQNPILMKYITAKPLSEEEMDQKYDNYLNQKTTFIYESYKVFDNNDYIGLASRRIFNDGIEIGYIIFEKYWHHGHGQRVCHQLVEETSDYKLYAIIDPKNMISKKILLNEGFKTKELKDDFELLERGL